MLNTNSYSQCCCQSLGLRIFGNDSSDVYIPNTNYEFDVSLFYSEVCHNSIKPSSNYNYHFLNSYDLDSNKYLNIETDCGAAKIQIIIKYKK